MSVADLFARKPLNTLRGIETDAIALTVQLAQLIFARKPLNTLRGIETFNLGVDGLLGRSALENPSTPSGVLKHNCIMHDTCQCSHHIVVDSKTPQHPPGY